MKIESQTHSLQKLITETTKGKNKREKLRIEGWQEQEAKTEKGNRVDQVIATVPTFLAPEEVL